MVNQLGAARERRGEDLERREGSEGQGEKVMSSKPTPRREIVERAEKLLGRKRIAERLKVGENVVASWGEGNGSPSDSQLMRLAELLAEYANRGR
jgi:ribosome-binding protein aMBF1 (putative translation factor)